MSTLFWVITWIISGTFTSLVILPYCIRLTNKINNENEKMCGLFVFSCYLCGPLGCIIFPLIAGLILLYHLEFPTINFAIIEKINKFWKLP